ncbi:L,D-transpeptidase [Bradyrhizobium sp. AZCC 2289]|uniref:L,D-transpeptidase n=1 Tax=Bradyrhizobium sp. AZCC 2289 TaxID=3117026 RepID=UPI002FEE9274
MSFKYLITEYSANGTASKGTLNWDADSWVVASGPFGNGTLPTGDYGVVKDQVSIAPPDDDMYIIDGEGKLGFFIRLKPNFDTDRKGFGIHPDGGLPGTHGCVGIVDSDARAFWAKWNSTDMADRPAVLNVLVSV